MFDGKAISLVIPVYNEENSIGDMLICVPAIIDEIIVVDNNSTDDTVKICHGFPVTIISEKRKGYGYAYMAGISAANGDIIIAMDGDNTYPLSEVNNLLYYFMASKCDFLSCARMYKAIMPLINKVGNKFISFFIRLFFKIKLKDSQSGMWIFKKDIFHEISPKDRGMGFSQEIKIRAWTKSHIKCREVGVFYRKRQRGRSKFRRVHDSVLVLKNLLSLLASVDNGI